MVTTRLVNANSTPAISTRNTESVDKLKANSYGVLLRFNISANGMLFVVREYSVSQIVMNVLPSVSLWQPAEGLSLSPFSHAHPLHSIMNSSEHHSNDTETMIIGFFIFVSPPVFVLDRIYRIKNLSRNPVNHVNPV
jgi:hypothetical protein